MKLGSWVIVGTAVAAIAALSCVGILPTAVIETGVILLFGWIAYLLRVIPQTRVNVGGMISAVICLIAVGVGGHAMARWLWREMRADATLAWRPRWTACIVAVVVLMFVAGIGAAGVAHQAAWLMRTDQRLVQISIAANRVKCASNMRQIGQVITLYAEANENRLPDTLGQLLITQDITPEVFVCPASDDERAPGAMPEEWAAHLGEGTLSYVYYGRGLKLPLPADLPLLAEPLKDHEAGMNILFGDGRVEWFSAEMASEVLRRTR